MNGQTIKCQPNCVGISSALTEALVIPVVTVGSRCRVARALEHASLYNPAPRIAGMADVDPDADDDATVRAWLVERSYDDRNLITLVYATPDGERALRKEIAATVLHQRGTRITAAIDADEAQLAAVDAADRERYATEAARMADRHDPDDEI